jgi:hypothetical protein
MERSRDRAPLPAVPVPARVARRLSALFAARGSAYYGPDRLGGKRRYPTEEKLPKRALDTGVAARLWETSLHLTDVAFA